MDPITHATIGAAMAISACKNRHAIRAAAIAGLVGGMLPDADILIRSADNPILQLTYHRHFTHALIFIPFGGLIAACLCWPVLRRYIPFLSILFFATVGYAVHGVIDAATNYGTHLFWSFTHHRESWSIISVIDILFTVPIFIGLIASFVTSKRLFAVAGVCYGCLYLIFGTIQHGRAMDAAQDIAERRGHNIERMEIKPSLGNNLLWRIQYQYNGHYYIDAVHIPWSGNNIKHYQGDHIPVLDTQKALELTANSPVQQEDIRAFIFFSDGWVSLRNNDPYQLGDVRFAMFPNSADALWSITLDPKHPEKHVSFHNHRDRKAGDIERYWNMIMGKDEKQ